MSRSGLSPLARFLYRCRSQTLSEAPSELQRGIRLAYLRIVLVSNHVHLLAIPTAPTSLARAIGRTHNDYARWLNFTRGESDTSGRVGSTPVPTTRHNAGSRCAMWN